MREIRQCVAALRADIGPRNLGIVRLMNVLAASRRRGHPDVRDDFMQSYLRCRLKYHFTSVELDEWAHAQADILERELDRRPGSPDDDGLHN
jgi:hypothetical protein